MSRILYIGDLNEYGRGFQRYRTLEDLGHEVFALSHTKVSSPGRIDPPTFLYRVRWKLKIPIDDMHVNEKVCAALRRSPFDVVWIEKGNMMWPWTLRHIKSQMPSVRLVSC